MDKRCHQSLVDYPKKTNENCVITVINPSPDISLVGVRIKVVCASAYHRNYSSGTSLYYNKSHFSSHSGLRDGSKFLGYDVSGIIEKLGLDVSPMCGLTIGQRVIIYPFPEFSYDFTEYIVVPNAKYLVPIPENLSFCVAAMLPSGGLLAKIAVSYAQEQVMSLVKNQEKCKILVVGNGGLSLWAVKIAIKQFGNMKYNGRVQVYVTSLNDEGFWIANLMVDGNIVQWDESLYEEQLIERTLNACDGLVDIVIDFGVTTRSLQRSLRCLNEGGVVVISGPASANIISKFTTKAEELGQSIQLVTNGSIGQLEDLVYYVASGEIEPPPFTVFPSGNSSKVIHKLCNSEINGCAVLRFNNIQ